MRILLLAEGIHEFANEGAPGLTATVPQEPRFGALRVLVERVIGKGIEFECKRVSDRDAIPARRFTVKGDSRKLVQRLEGWLRVAKKQNFDAVVAVIDRDDDPDRIRQVDAAQISELPTKRAFGVAIRSFDAWMLADEVALSQALGQTVQPQPDPEVESNPKREVERLHKENSCTKWMRDVYAEVMAVVRVDQLDKRCPKGFAPFHRRLGELVSSTPTAA